MLAFAGLLVALAPQGQVGSCPSGISLSATQSLCFHDMLPSPMTEEFLCSAATEDFRCCCDHGRVQSSDSKCYANFDSSGSAYQCGETSILSKFTNSGFTIWSVRRPWPPPSRSRPNIAGAGGRPRRRDRRDHRRREPHRRGTGRRRDSGALGAVKPHIDPLRPPRPPPSRLHPASIGRPVTGAGTAV